MRDIAPTAIRLPPDLREALVRECEINRRTLSGEIVMRLRHTFAQEEAGDSLTTEPTKGSMALAPSHQVLTDAQRLMVRLFDGLAPEKQLALLTFLKR